MGYADDVASAYVSMGWYEPHPMTRTSRGSVVEQWKAGA
jgi:hypothetical protein